MKNKIFRKLSTLFATVALLATVLVVPGAKAALTNGAVELGSYATSATAVASKFTFTTDVTATTGDAIKITLPGAFTAGDVADATGACTLYDDGSEVTAISSADLTSNVLTIVLGSGDPNPSIAIGAEVEVVCDTTIIDTNPSSAGDQTISFAIDQGDNGSDESTGSADVTILGAYPQMALSNYYTNSASVGSDFYFNNTATSTTRRLEIEFPSEFTVGAVADASSNTTVFNGLDEVALDSVAVADNAGTMTMTIDFTSAVAQNNSLHVVLDNTIIDNNPATASTYTFDVNYYNESEGTYTLQDTASPTATIEATLASDAINVTDVTLSNTAMDATAVSSVFEFTNGADIPAGGEIVVTFPEEFTMGDIADATGELTLTDDGSTLTVVTADLTSKVLTIVAPSTIAANSEIVLSLTTNVIDQNPSLAGQYGIQIMSKDDEGTTIGTGIGYALITDSTVTITATVQEALIMTLDDTSVNLNVDPSVNNGEDYSQKTLLNVKTNAANGYKIQAQLQDSDTNATLKNGTHNINTGSVYDGASYTPNTFSYVAYNDDETKDKAGLKSDIESANGTGTFQASSSDLSLYNGTASGVGFASNTNSQDHTIYYILYVDYQTVAGIYSANVIYTALPTF